MKFDNDSRSNLLARLFSYAPRGDRLALEDYCTEALAWCLITNANLSERFLDAVKESLGPRLLPILRAYKGALQIGTQIPYDPKAEDEETQPASAGGRFDLVVESSAPQQFIIVIESKVKFDKQLGSQVDRYRKEVSSRKYIERYVVSLTPTVRSSAGADGHIFWGAVYKLLKSEAPSVLGKSQSTDFFTHFATFLEQHGLDTLKMKIPTTADCAAISDSIEFFLGAQQVFKRLGNVRQADGAPIFGGRAAKQPFFDPESEHKSDSGLYYSILSQRPERQWYAGFHITPVTAGSARLLQYLQVQVPNDFNPSEQGLISGKHTCEKNIYWFTVEKQITEKDDPDGVYAWFEDRISEFCTQLSEKAK